MRRKLALLFPGQGAQFAGMLGPFLGEPHAQKLIEIAKGALGYDLASIIESPPLASSSLNETQVTQPAILLTSLCNYYAFVKEHPQVANGEWDVAMAGHSIGEYSALAASGVLSPDDAFKLIVPEKWYSFNNIHDLGMARIFNVEGKARSHGRHQSECSQSPGTS